MTSTFRGSSRALPHGNDYNPMALWQLDGNYRDSGPNGLHLTLESGVERYFRFGGLQGFMFDGASNLVYNTVPTILQILGDMTIEFIMNMPALAQTVLIGTGDPGTDTDPANNQLYTISYNANATQGLAAVWEDGAGANDIHIVQGSPSGGVLTHVALVKSDGGKSAQFYLNGAPTGPKGTGFNTATGGTAGKFRICADQSVGAKSTGFMSSVKIIGSALSAGQVKDEYNRTLGPLYGRRP